MHTNCGQETEGKKSVGRYRHRKEDDIQMDLTQHVRMWTGLVCLRTGSSDRFMWMYEFHKR